MAFNVRQAARSGTGATALHHRWGSRSAKPRAVTRRSQVPVLRIQHSNVEGIIHRAVRRTCDPPASRTSRGGASCATSGCASTRNGGACCASDASDAASSCIWVLIRQVLIRVRTRTKSQEIDHSEPSGAVRWSMCHAGWGRTFCASSASKMSSVVGRPAVRKSRRVVPPPRCAPMYRLRAAQTKTTKSLAVRFFGIASWDRPVSTLTDAPSPHLG